MPPIGNCRRAGPPKGGGFGKCLGTNKSATRGATEKPSHPQAYRQEIEQGKVGASYGSYANRTTGSA